MSSTVLVFFFGWSAFLGAMATVLAHTRVEGEKKKKEREIHPAAETLFETERNADAESERGPGGWGVYRVEKRFYKG